MAKILLVEDDKELCGMIESWLKEEHVLESANDGVGGLDLLRFYEYDLAIVDWELPGMTGPEILKQYRSGGGKCPILMLTGKSEIDDKEEGFESGADDYLTKPFHPRELAARISALLRRPPSFAPVVLTVRDVELDSRTHLVRIAGKPVHLMPKEFALLEFFMKHPGEAFSTDALLNRVWPSDSEVSTESVKTYIARLRKRLDSAREVPLISTVHGVGYRLDP